MKLLLTSNGFYTEKIKEQFLKLLDGVPKAMNVAIITTASPKKEKNPFAQKAKRDFIEMGFEKIEFIDVEFDDPKRLLGKDVIYINGGNPFHLLFHVKKSGADKILQQLASRNVAIVGVSAGSVILGPNMKVVHFFTPEMNAYKMKDFSALGLTDQIIFPHYDREDIFKDEFNRSIEERLTEFELLENCKVTRLKDEDYIIINE